MKKNWAQHVDMSDIKYGDALNRYVHLLPPTEREEVERRVEQLFGTIRRQFETPNTFLNWLGGLFFNLGRLEGKIDFYLTRWIRGDKMKPQPPAVADVLLSIFVKPRLRDALIGDLTQRFMGHVELYGPRRARLFYWGATIRSLGPLAWSTFKRLVKWGVFVDAFRRLFGG